MTTSTFRSLKTSASTSRGAEAPDHRTGSSRGSSIRHHSSSSDPSSGRSPMSVRWSIAIPFRPIVGRKRWEGGAVVVSPFADALYSSAVTRLFLDLFVQVEAVAPAIEDVPFAIATMRPAPDRTDYRLGPFPFAGLQRLNRPDLSMALRATTADENGEDAPAERRSP